MWSFLTPLGIDAMNTKATRALEAVSHHFGVLGVAQRLLHLLQEPETGAVAILIQALTVVWSPRALHAAISGAIAFLVCLRPSLAHVLHQFASCRTVTSNAI